MDNKALLTKFYTAFQAKDAKTMAECYHKDIVFEDPAFGILQGERAGAMWEMLCISGKDLKMEFSGIDANEQTGKAHWEAWYTFSATGKKVHNIIDAEFEFKDGKIIKHTDHFSFKKWSKQAFGLVGSLVGGTTFFQNQFNKQANSLLDKHITKQNGK
ncbi:MAG: nuclear transport factor 2 family protein [Flavobacteriales bacterium]|jgi:ketosteroid isomerase-like protein|nr:nuclear transport factor 2 family protein [Flavobacteriales bacterium]